MYCGIYSDMFSPEILLVSCPKSRDRKVEDCDCCSNRIEIYINDRLRGTCVDCSYTSIE